MTDAALPLHVETLGPAPGPGVDTYVMVHGYGGSSFTWRTWAPALARRGHVVLVDLKGHGAAPKPDDGRYAPADHAELLERLVRARGLGRLTLVGHSLGGGVALLTALRLRDASLASGSGSPLRRLVLVAGAAYPQRLPPFVALSHRPRLSALLMRALGARLVVRWVLRSIVHDPGSVTEEQIAGYAQPLRSAETIRALMACARCIVPENLAELTPRYREIDVPALLLWGRHDPVVPLAVGERLARELPRAWLHVMEACGHLPPEEHPAESLQVLEAFLEEGLEAYPTTAFGRIV